MTIVLGALAALVAATALVQVSISRNGPDAGSAHGSQQLADAYARLPLTFAENRGQTDGRVRYLAHGDRYGFYFTPDSVGISLLERGGTTGVNLFLDFVGARTGVSMTAADRAASTVSYLRADTAGASRGGLPTYGEVVYQQLWSGVDMAVAGRDGVLKYEFRVAPGAPVEDIGLAYRGAAGLATDAGGALLVDTALGALRDTPPVSYQVIDGKRVPVESRYKLTGQDSYGFTVGDYDPAYELVIDPGLEYATYLGGFGNQTGAAIAADAAGNAYVTGFTQSPTFPTTPGAFDRTGSPSNDLDAFVSKLNPSGTALVYSTFLGGGNFDWGRDIAVDAAGNAYVGGQTRSSNFPTTGGAFDPTFNVDSCPRCGIDQYDAFVAKLNPSGSGLAYSTFLGGFDLDDILALTVDGAGQVYVTGQTLSSNFPTTAGAFDSTRNGDYEGFVAKFNASGSQLVYSTYLGGTDNELPGAISVDPAGNAVVGGSTRSADYPTTPGSLKPVHSGGEFLELFDGFVTKVNATGSALVYSTFLGGTKQDSVSEVIADAAGNTYVLGSTQSPEFPTTPGTFDTAFDLSSQSFALKLNPAGSDLLYSTFLGKAGGGSGVVIADGSLWLAGGSGSADAFVTPDAVDSQLGGTADAYVARLNPTATALDYATFLGGSGSDGAADMALDPAGNVYVTGRTGSTDFPTTEGAVDRTYGGDPFIAGLDAWVAKITVGPGTPPPTSPAPSPSTPVSPSPSTPAPTTPVPTTPAPTSPGQTLAAPAQLSPGNDARFRPGTTITFDWGDVPGAVSYTIQIDNSQSFQAPFTVDATTAASQHVASGLPIQRMWWRVRAIDANGNPGAWSQARRFELKN